MGMLAGGEEATEMDRVSGTEEDGLVSKVVEKGWMGDLDGRVSSCEPCKTRTDREIANRGVPESVSDVGKCAIIQLISS